MKRLNWSNIKRSKKTRRPLRRKRRGGLNRGNLNSRFEGRKRRRMISSVLNKNNFRLKLQPGDELSSILPASRR